MQITTSYGSSAAHRCRGPAQTFPPFFSLHSVLRCWDISLSILTCFPVWGWTVLSVYLHTRRYLPWVSFTGWRWAERKSKLWRKCRLPLQGTIFKTKLKSVRFHRHKIHHQHISLFRGYVLDLIHFLSTTTLPVVFFLFFFLQYLLTKYLPSESAALAKIMTLI